MKTDITRNRMLNRGINNFLFSGYNSTSLLNAKKGVRSMPAKINSAINLRPSIFSAKT